MKKPFTNVEWEKKIINTFIGTTRHKELFIDVVLLSETKKTFIEITKKTTFCRPFTDIM